MKKIYSVLFLSFLLFALSSCYDSIVNTPGTFNQKAIEKYQRDMVEFYNDPETTPLKEGEKEDFKGITFFPVSEDYFVKARVEIIQAGDTISMPTSARKIKKYIEYARLHFSLGGKENTLMAYIQVPSSEPSLMKEKVVDLFIPFKDGTNGLTSYGAGRYIDLRSDEIVNGELAIDFNRAYNPYCAYSIFYNCPIPPAVNHLKIDIPAGASYED